MKDHKSHQKSLQGRPRVYRSRCARSGNANSPGRHVDDGMVLLAHCHEKGLTLTYTAISSSNITEMMEWDSAQCCHLIMAQHVKLVDWQSIQ
jgi:hypothetical protein